MRKIPLTLRIKDGGSHMNMTCPELDLDMWFVQKPFRHKSRSEMMATALYQFAIAIPNLNYGLDILDTTIFIEGKVPYKIFIKKRDVDRHKAMNDKFIRLINLVWTELNINKIVHINRWYKLKIKIKERYHVVSSWCSSRCDQISNRNSSG